MTKTYCDICGEEVIDETGYGVALEVGDPEAPVISFDDVCNKCNTKLRASIEALLKEMGWKE